MSHGCDCAECMLSDSRWAPYRAQQKALKDDCPLGVHVSDLKRAGPGYVEYWCKHCKVDVSSTNHGERIGTRKR